MKINMASPILSITGEPVVGEDGTPVTLRAIVQNALMTLTRHDEQIDGAQRNRMYQLTMKANEDEVDFKAEDIAFIKERIGRVSTPLAVGRAYELLDPEN